jgi:hypothetical protein
MEPTMFQTKQEALPTELNDNQEKQQTPEEIIKTLFSEKESYQQATLNERNDINDIYQVYVGHIVDTDPNDKSKSKENTNKLRTEIAYIKPSIFSGTPEIEVEPIGEEDKDFAKIAEKIINYRFETICQFYEKIEAWVTQSCAFGTSLLRVIWRFETKDNGDGTVTPIVDEPDVEIPNILDCFFNPIIPNVENQNSLIFRSVVPLDEVKENPIYDFKDDQGLIRERIASKGMGQTNQFDSSRQVKSDSIDMQKASIGTIEIYERITKDRIQTVADGKERLVLRDVANPDEEVPVIKLTHEPNAIPNRFSGFGVGHNTLGIGKLINKLKNKMIDNVSMTNNIFTFFAKGTNIDKKQLNVKPGGGAEVDTAGGSIRDKVMFAQFPDILSGAVMLQNSLEDDHKRASGANDLLQGSASNKTLGQDQIASTYSSNRFELINRRFKKALADVARVVLNMELSRIQSMDAEILRIFPLQAEVVNGEVEWSRETVYQMLISQEAKDAKFNIKVKGETNVAKNKDIQIKQMVDLYNLFGPILPPQNQMEWARKLLELRGIDEIDKLVPDPQAFAQQQQEQMMAQQGALNPQMMQQGMPQQPQI